MRPKDPKDDNFGNFGSSVWQVLFARLMGLDGCRVSPLAHSSSSAAQPSNILQHSATIVQSTVHAKRDADGSIKRNGRRVEVARRKRVGVLDNDLGGVLDSGDETDLEALGRQEPSQHPRPHERNQKLKQ